MDSVLLLVVVVSLIIALVSVVVLTEPRLIVVGEEAEA